MKNIKSILFFAMLLIPALSSGADEQAINVDSRYLGSWNGTWLEGMSSGKVALEIRETGGQLSLSPLPNFGAQPAAIAKVVGNENRVGFQTAGADGRSMRFDLKPSGDFKKLTGKAHYDGLHMELELKRAP